MKNYYMKSTSFITVIILFYIVNIACISKNSNSYFKETDKITSNNIDTFVVVQKVPKGISGSSVRKVEYFVRINSINYPPVVLITETKKGLVVSLNSNFGDYSSENINDTSILRKKTEKDLVKAFLSSEDKYNNIRQILKRSSEDFELEQTYVIFADLLTFEEEALQITEEYNMLYGLKYNDLSNERLVKIIKASNLYNNLTRLFNEYSIKMGKVYVEDIMDISLNRLEFKISKNKLPYVIDSRIIISTIN